MRVDDPRHQRRRRTTLWPPKLCSALWLLQLVYSSPDALAGNADEILLGNQALLLGGAVTASVNGGEALWYNPAGLGRAGVSNKFDMSASAYTGRWVNLPNFLTTRDGASAGGNYQELLAVPSTVCFVRQLGKRLALGAGVFVPRYSQIQLQTLLDSEQGFRWSLLATDNIARYHFSAGLAWQPRASLRIGFATSVIYESETVGLEFAGVGGADRELDQTFIILARQVVRQSVGASLRVGVQWEPHPNWIVGAALRSPGVFFGNDTTGLDTTAYAGDVGTPAVPIRSAALEDLQARDFSVEVLTPMRALLGLAYRHGRWHFAFDGDIQAGLSSDAVARNEKPMWNLRAGARVQLSESLRLGLGLFTDRSTARTTDELRADFFGFSSGMTYTNAHKLAANEKADQISFSTTIGLRYAVGLGEVASLTLPATGITPEVAFDRAVEVTAHEVTIHVGSALYF
jgi:hypothetical protein